MNSRDRERPKGAKARGVDDDELAELVRLALVATGGPGGLRPLRKDIPDAAVADARKPDRDGRHGSPPAQFRLYMFDGRREAGQRMTRVLPLGASVEADAIREADERRNGQYAELWRGEQVVRIFDDGELAFGSSFGRARRQPPRPCSDDRRR